MKSVGDFEYVRSIYDACNGADKSAVCPVLMDKLKNKYERFKISHIY